MRQICALCAMLMLGTACVDPEEVATHDQAVTGTASGQLDVPLPDTDPLPPSSEGPPIAGEAVPAAVRLKQAEYLAVLNARLVEWNAAGKSEQEIAALQTALKRQYLED